MDSRASFTELAISHSEFEDQTLRYFGSWDPHPSTKTLRHNILHISVADPRAEQREFGIAVNAVTVFVSPFR